jgi:hypothetical protein
MSQTIDTTGAVRINTGGSGIGPSGILFTFNEVGTISLVLSKNTAPPGSAVSLQNIGYVDGNGTVQAAGTAISADGTARVSADDASLDIWATTTVTSGYVVVSQTPANTNVPSLNGVAAADAIFDIVGLPAATATSAGGAVTVTAAAGGSTSGAGGDVTITAGAGTAGNASGGSVILAPGAKHGTGLDGGLFNRATIPFRKMPTPGTATDTATLTAAQITGGVLVATPTNAANYTVITGTLLLAALPADIAANDSFDLTIINIGGTGDDITLLVAEDVTFVGDVVVRPVADSGTEQAGQGTFRFRYIGTTVFVAYRVA